MPNQQTKQIDFLTTDVGRGHRFYLEGLKSAIVEKTPQIQSQIFIASEESGAVASLGWIVINSLYRRGSRTDWFGAQYSQLRSESNPQSESLALQLFGAGLRRWWSNRRNPLIVDHPLLVGLLKATNDHQRRFPLIYMHGELVAPNESLVTDADLIIVPTGEVKQKFLAAGAEKNSVTVSGICVERALPPLAQKAIAARLERIKTSSQLTGAFFSSGAEPPEHCERLLLAARSCLNNQQRVIVFAAEAGRLANTISNAGLLSEAGLTLKTYSSIPSEESQLASVFCEIDYFVAPAHERTNWAIGLRLPFFIIEPYFGSFAPLNRNLAISSAKAKLISSSKAATNFAKYLNELRNTGELEKMNLVGSSPGNEHHSLEPINRFNGFSRAADSLLEKLNEIS